MHKLQTPPPSPPPPARCRCINQNKEREREKEREELYLFFFSVKSSQNKTEPLLHFSKVPCRMTILQSFLPRVWGSLVHFRCHGVVVCFSSCSEKASLFLRTLTGFLFLGFLGFLAFFFFLFKCHSDCQPKSTDFCPSWLLPILRCHKWLLVTLNEALPQQTWTFLSSVPTGRTTAWPRMLFHSLGDVITARHPSWTPCKPGGLSTFRGFSSSVIVGRNHCRASPIELRQTTPILAA